MNVVLAFGGGAITGAVLAYRKKNALYALLGPLAGSVAGASGFDVVDPWVMLLIGLGAPIPMMLVYEGLARMGVDEQKIVPLGLGAGIYGALLVGIVQWGTPTGGFIGINEGEFAFQNAEINLFWQFIGVAATVGIAFVAALVLVYGLDRVMGLRISEEQELVGNDQSYWQVPPIGAELGPSPQAPVAGTAAPQAGGAPPVT
jgi:Amt family ammonium transporter